MPDDLTRIVNQAGPQIDQVELAWRPFIPKITACQQLPFERRNACADALFSENKYKLLGEHVAGVLRPIVTWFPEMRRDFVARPLGEAMARCMLDGTPLRFCIRTTLAVVNVMVQ